MSWTGIAWKQLDTSSPGSVTSWKAKFKAAKSKDEARREIDDWYNRKSW
ncbi:hypothetical protein FHS21_006164 [Phyllobacterium trifolii]|uniref:Uncharacterized protein n=1 Tax=Phyllobacterium trifolii TaxID=300193 RepID=A0A839ULG5_9HYPH|nr:hypothetical protein [Phyllobacterium trifolii]